MVHYDTPPGEKYAPIQIHEEMVNLLISNVADAGGEEGKGRSIDAADVVRSRMRRRVLDPIHAEIILWVLGMKGEKVGIPVEWMREWVSGE